MTSDVEQRLRAIQDALRLIALQVQQLQQLAASLNQTTLLLRQSQGPSS